MEQIPLGINAGNYIESNRHIGYTIETAIADIIDNSIYAKATEINIEMVWENYNTTEPYVQIFDNGIGMSNSELIESMRLACKSPSDERNPDDLGRFGLGLKTASFSQCKVLTVGTRKLNDEACCKRWDVDYHKGKDDFFLTDLSPKEAGMVNTIPHPFGSIVQWKNLDQLNIPDTMNTLEKEKHWLALLEKVKKHVAITFGSFVNKKSIKGIIFYFNGSKIKAWDPFLLAHEGTNRLTKIDIPFNSHKIIVQSFILPSKLPTDEYELIGGEKGWNEQQGFYVYRNNRLIISGSWLDLPGFKKKEAYRLARIRIDIDNSMDAAWKIDIKKENAVCPPSLVSKLIPYAKLARQESSKVFRSRGKTLRRNTKNIKNTFIWEYGIRKDTPFYAVNKNHPLLKNFITSLSSEQAKDFKSILSIIENTIPIMSILERETESKGTFIENSASELNESKIKQIFVQTVESLIEEHKGNNLYDAVDFCRCCEPFDQYYEVIDAVCEAKGWKK